MPTVFVVTPAFCTDDNRRLPLLLQTIHWVRQQTHGDYLHIVVDDGSTDSTPAVLERLSRSDQRLRVFRKKNGGSSAAINHGIKQALASNRPDYITVCHSDDLLLPNSLEMRVKLATNSKAELVYTDELVIYHTGRPPKHRSAREYATSEKLFNGLLEHIGIPYGTMLWDANFFLNKLQGFDERLTSAEDWDIALRSAKELKAGQAAHAMDHCVTMAKRDHKDCLRLKNIRDGTKERCYAIILRKHLNEEEYQDAMAREKCSRLQQPKLLVRMKEMLHRLERPKRLHDALASMRHRRQLRQMRLAYPNEIEYDAYIGAFLKQLDEVDYGLMLDRAA